MLFKECLAAAEQDPEISPREAQHFVDKITGQMREQAELQGDPSHCTCGVERRAELSALGSLAGCFLTLGSGLGLVGTVSARR